MGNCKSKELIPIDEENNSFIGVELPDSSTDDSSKNSRTILFFLNNEFKPKKKSMLKYNGTQIEDDEASEGEQTIL